MYTERNMFHVFKSNIYISLQSILLIVYDVCFSQAICSLFNKERKCLIQHMLLSQKPD